MARAIGEWGLGERERREEEGRAEYLCRHRQESSNDQSQEHITQNENHKDNIDGMPAKCEYIREERRRKRNPI